MLSLEPKFSLTQSGKERALIKHSEYRTRTGGYVDRILSVLGKSDRPLSSREISRISGIDKMYVNKTIHMLETARFVYESVSRFRIY